MSYMRTYVTISLAFCIALNCAAPADAQEMRLEDVIAAKFKHLGLRQAVFSRNIANADTPDYRAMALETYAEKRKRAGMIASPRMAVTHPGHMRPKSNYASRPYEDPAAQFFKPNGNNVSLERQSLMAAHNARMHQETAGVMRKLRDLKKLAISGSQ